MGAPIIVQPRQNPWNNLLPQLFLMKIKHNMDMDVAEAEIKLKSAQLKETRAYTEGRDKVKRQGALAEKGFTPASEGDANAVDMPIAGGKYKPFKAQKITIDGIELIEKSPGNFIKAPTASEKSPTELMLIQKAREGDVGAQRDLQTIQNRKLERAKAGAIQMNSLIGQKEKLKDEAYYKGPKFIEDVSKDVKNLTGRKYKWMTPKQIADQEELLADKRVRIRYPDAEYGDIDGQVGWYTKDADGNYKLEIPWSRFKEKMDTK